MAEDFREGTENLSDESFDPDLKGVVVDLDEEHRRKVWIVFSFVFVVIVALFTWAYWYLAKTDEELLEERLQQRMEVVAMLRQVRSIVSSNSASTELLIEAVNITLDIARTPLRHGVGGYAPLIPERQLAFMEALEALLRLRLEKGMGASDQPDAYAETYLDLLHKVGQQRLEYFEDGSMERIPLLDTAWVVKQISNERRNISFIDQHEIQELERQLTELEASEASGLTIAAYRLGAWYRYYNDLESAERCFQIGRRFVEGYELAGDYIPGVKPKGLNHFWEAYVSTLESLGEMRLQNGHYREARSLLSRIFSTPVSVTQISSPYELNRIAPEQAEQIEVLREDVKILQKALEDPLLIPSFPFFSQNDPVIRLDFILPQLRQGAQGVGFPGVVWGALSDSVQDLVLMNGELDANEKDLIRKELVTLFNIFIDDPNFFREVAVSPDFLTTRCRELLSLAETHVLSTDEYGLLNRELIELALNGAIDRVFVLSDGTRLSNRLDQDQIKQYLVYTERLLNEPMLDSNERQRLVDELNAIKSGSFIPTLQEFEVQLKNFGFFYDRVVQKASESVQQQHQILRQLSRRIRELEEKENVELVRLADIHKKEGQARAALARAEKTRDEANKSQKEVEAAAAILYISLERQLERTLDTLSYLESQQARNQAEQEDPEEVLLSQLEEQVTLREQYLELLEGLRATGGERELERLRIEKTRLEGLIEALRSRVEESSGDEREILEVELAEYQASRNDLLVEFERLYGPLRDIVDVIAAREEEILKTEVQLRESREEISELTGYTGHPGSLEEKSQRLSELFLRKDQNLLSAPLYDAEIYRLSKEVAEDHGRLNVLLQKEAQARTFLATMYPAFFHNKLLFAGGGDLAPLKEHLKRQSELMEEYSTLWRVNELTTDIHLQKQLILGSLQEISVELAPERQFSLEQTQNLTRHMQSLLTARKRLRRDEYLLKELMQGHHFQEAVRQVTGKGYLIDTVEMFQLEHEMGLNISEYRRVFDERAGLLVQLRELSKSKESLEQEKIEAVRVRNQERVDELIPLVAEKDHLIGLVTKKELQVNSRLRQLAKDYEKRFQKATVFRERIQPEITQLSRRILDLNQEMIDNEHQVESLIEEIFSTAKDLKGSITNLTADKLTSLDEIIETQKSELQRLNKVRDMKRGENYYKSKALFWVGKTFYEQSRLPSYGDLLKSNSFPDIVLRDEQRHAQLKFEEFIPSEQQEEHAIISKTTELDEKQAAYQYWIESLEKNALNIFLYDLPRHIPPAANAEENLVTQPPSRVKDGQIFIARSRFLSGQIYLKRGLRFIQGSKKKISKPSERAIQELDQATTSFLSLLSFTYPFGHKNAENSSLTEPRMGAQEFPYRQRHPVYLDDEAGIYLGVCAALKGDYHQSIEYFRDILSSMIERAERIKAVTNQSETFMEPIDPILTGATIQPSQAHPIYASLLSMTPLAHEVLYRLGKNYQQLAEEQYQLSLELSYLPGENAKHVQGRFQDYSRKALTYYSQLIHTQAYSPFRRAALLKRAQLFKRLGYYQDARQDFIAILGAPGDRGGSLDIKDITSKGDLPGELSPGFSYVSFELGKLHLENKNYEAAAEAFVKAKEGDPEDSFVLKARAAFAEALIQSKDWLMADLILTELIKEYPSQSDRRKGLYNVELWIQHAYVKTQLGNLSAASAVLKQVISRAPPALLKDEHLDLSDRYGLVLLEQEYRDTIRPLAEASLALADLAFKQRQSEEAQTHYRDAETLFMRVPWREDRLMRELKQPDYLAYIREKGLLARWGSLKTTIQDLMHSSLKGYRQEFDSISFENDADNKIKEIVGKIGEVLDNVSDTRHEFEEMLARVDAFYEREQQKLPEVIERERVTYQRQAERSLGQTSATRYDALRRIRELLKSLEGDRITLSIENMRNLFPIDSLEHQLIDDFAYIYARRLPLTDEDRKFMAPNYSNLQNLQSIPNAQERFASLPQELKVWTEEQMRQSGLDDVFIPVSAQAGILEEVDLFRVSLLSHLQDSESYRRLTELIDLYIEKANHEPSRIISQEGVWQMVELATLTAEHIQDWERLEKYTRYLLAPERRQFFLMEDSSGRFRVELSLARALMHLGQKTYGDIVFILRPEDQAKAEQLAERQISESRRLLSKLIEIPGDETTAVLTRIQAKRLLGQMGA